MEIFTFFLLFMLFISCNHSSAYVCKELNSLPHQSDLICIENPKNRDTDEDVVTFYLLGDWGEGNNHQRAVANALKKDIADLDKRQIEPFVIGAGDNVYSAGLPQKPFDDLEVRTLLKEKFGDIYAGITYNDKPIPFYVVPGNHDYGRARKCNNPIEGWGARIHEETTAEAIYSGKCNGLPIFKSYPIVHELESCIIDDSNDDKEHKTLQQHNISLLAIPQKIEIPHLESILFVALDTQVLLDLYLQEDYDKIQKHLQMLKQILEENPYTWKILIGHHAVATYGEHGGFRPLRQWLWSGFRDWICPYLRPVTIVWLPLLLTSAEQIYLSISPTIQDTNHQAYNKFVNDLTKIMQQYNVDLYLAGHDHSLQLLEIQKNCFQVISGSASKLDAVGSGDETLFAHEAPGFVRLDVRGQHLWIEFFEVNIETSNSKNSALFLLSKDLK